MNYVLSPIKTYTCPPPFHCDYGENIYADEGVFINFGAVIGAGAVVTRDIPADTLAGGNPVRVVKQLNE